ncbi:hypothetical protein [Paraburkholderia sp. BCC1884]|uniref:terminase small subunit-like protein n=1 Tax=Paraburkholderia sp. BCC1884 TaxID=2562668 RepID=UPI001181DF56|nr:hypothetical protein [Paraburkholderia sp. BCC1884]
MAIQFKTMGATKHHVKVNKTAVSVAEVEQAANVLPMKAKTGQKPIVEAKFLAVIEWIRRGETAAQACKRPGMPGLSTFHDWRNRNERNEQLYREALAIQPDDMVDDIFPMLDSLFNGLKSVDASARLGRARLRIQHVQWLASRRDPVHYGNQVAGDDGVFKLVNSPDDDKGESDTKKKVS